MSSQAARTHTHGSNRAKPKDNTDRKVVFKSVLDNPYRIQWPYVSTNVQNSILAHVISLLDGVPAFRRTRYLENRKRRQSFTNQGNERKKRKGNNSRGDTGDKTLGCGTPDDAGPSKISNPDESVDIRPELPNTLQHFTFGINEVTKRLESQVQASRSLFKMSSNADVDLPPPITIKTVLVCRADVDPPLLIAHIPHLVASYNTSVSTIPSSQSLEPIKLVSLPRGAEFTLAEALGLRRVSVVAINGVQSTAPELPSFRTLMETVPTLTAPWLTAQADVIGAEKSLIPTHIKQVRTCAPRDMRAAKERRTKQRTEAKERRREMRKARKQSVHVRLTL